VLRDYYLPDSLCRDGLMRLLQLKNEVNVMLSYVTENREQRTESRGQRAEGRLNSADLISRLLQLLQGCYKGGTRVVQGYHKGVTRVL
jgi:hypothetical protein